MERRHENHARQKPTVAPRQLDFSENNSENDTEILRQRKARLTAQFQQLQLQQDGQRSVQQQEQILQELLQLTHDELLQYDGGEHKHDAPVQQQQQATSPENRSNSTQIVTPTSSRKRRKCQANHLAHPDLKKAKLVRDQPSRHDFDRPVRYLGGDETQFQRIGTTIIKAIQESQAEGQSGALRWKKVLSHSFQETNPDTGYGFCFLSKKWMEQPDTNFGKYILPSGFGLRKCETPGQPFYNPKRHVGHVHVDATTAILSVTNGKKTVKIARPDDCSKLTPDTQHGKGFYKDKPFDDGNHDDNDEVWETVVLLPGMALLIPAGWPHCILSEPNTLGISIKVRDLSK